MNATTQGAVEQPLTGWRVLNTRAKAQSAALSNLLRERGADVIEIPTIEINPPRSYKALDAALKNIAQYDWLILTSVNGVDALFTRIKKLKLSTDTLRHVQIAAIGPATKKAIERQGLAVAVTPSEYIAEAVVDALRGKTEGKKILLARAKVARDVLPKELRKTAAQVDVVEAYETKIPAAARAKLQKLFSSEQNRPEVVTFTSSSTAANFLQLLDKKHHNRLREIWLASIGPVTSKTLLDAGFPPTVEAREYNMNGLVLAIVEQVHKAASQQWLERLGLKG